MDWKRYLSGSRRWFVLPAALLLFGFSHPYYVSICQIDHNPQTRSLEIAFKIFTNDLERALEVQGRGKLYLGSKRESKDADRYLFDYIKNNFDMSVNGKGVELTYVGKEVEIDVTWCYVEVLNIPNVKNVTITNRILQNLYDGQTNIVHIKVGDTRRSMLLRKGKLTDRVEF